MNKDKIIKKGTIVEIHTCCNLAGSDSVEDYTLECDMTEDQLNELATEMALEDIQPEGYFTLKRQEHDSTKTN